MCQRKSWCCFCFISKPNHFFPPRQTHKWLGPTTSWKWKFQPLWKKKINLDIFKMRENKSVPQGQRRKKELVDEWRLRQKVLLLGTHTHIHSTISTKCWCDLQEFSLNGVQGHQPQYSYHLLLQEWQEFHLLLFVQVVGSEVDKADRFFLTCYTSMTVFWKMKLIFVQFWQSTIAISRCFSSMVWSNKSRPAKFTRTKFALVFIVQNGGCPFSLW